VQEAAAKGSLAEPCSELLYQNAIRAAAAQGNHAEVMRLAERLRQELADLDSEDGMDPETAQLVSAATRQ
jgi:hypothetical protein